jgi:hypothetical protein
MSRGAWGVVDALVLDYPAAPLAALAAGVVFFAYLLGCRVRLWPRRARAPAVPVRPTAPAWIRCGDVCVLSRAYVADGRAVVCVRTPVDNEGEGAYESDGLLTIVAHAAASFRESVARHWGGAWVPCPSQLAFLAESLASVRAVVPCETGMARSPAGTLFLYPGDVTTIAAALEK